MSCLNGIAERQVFVMDRSKYKDLFVSESQEHLQAFYEAILDLEREPDSAEPLECISRSAHTLKGMAAMMGYEGMTQLAYDVEYLLDRVRKGTVAIAPMLIDLLFECAGTLNTMLEDIVAERESARPGSRAAQDRPISVNLPETAKPKERG
jgi:two-component system chemotaxis sensor kinase CheA